MISSLKNSPVDYVNPNIGTIGHLLTATSPTVSLPHGMAQANPVFTPSIVDRYLADKIYGFSFSALNLMAATNKYNSKYSVEQYASCFDHDLELVTPYYYSALLEDYNISFGYTISQHSYYSRIIFPEERDSNIIFGLVNEASLEIVDSKTIKCNAKVSGVSCYMYVELSTPFNDYKLLSERAEGCDVRVILTYSTKQNEYIDVKIGVSYIDYEQAAANLNNELEIWDFEEVKSKARSIWNTALNKIEVSGCSDKEKTIFYTALYRSLLRMNNITEDGKYFSGFDGEIHEKAGNDFYVNDGIWDTYRSMHPLQLLIEPKCAVDMIQSYVRMYEQSGWLPRFPFIGGDNPVMIGNHTSAFIADVVVKGYKNIELEKAYEAMRKNSIEGTKLPWRKGPATELDRIYIEKGFFPALGKDETEWIKEVHPFEKRQAVAVTLEHAYDDWCIAQVAKILNKENDYTYFMKAANNYRNVFNEETGFMSPRTEEGNWVEDFNPKLGGGQGGRDYFAECNSWIYSFHVQHDVQGLIELMGGRKKLEEKLDHLFVEQYDVPKYFFLQQFPDATGLIGQYCQGNEPAFHIPYLYNYTGAPWKTQRKVREIMKLWFNDGPLGICGDEDGGAMSSWYVFSAMGFYPVCPGRPVYDIGSPIFEEVKINMEENKTFVISAEKVSTKNKYIQSATLNGKPLNRPWLWHSEISEGGVLVLIMDERPNKSWGSEQEEVPPSMSIMR